MTSPSAVPPPSGPEFTPRLPRDPLREAIGALTRRPEPELLPGLLQAAQLDPAQAEAAQALALRLARTLRERKPGVGRAGLVQGLLQEFALSSQEGVALMCLAEALLRIPDAATRDALIRDKIARGDWRAHLGASPSLFVNAAAWGLLLSGKLVATHSDEGLGAALKRVVGRGGEPLIRKGVDLTMRLMGEQFVIGETIGGALAAARKREAQGFRHSYDMLGEAALTDADARRCLAAYEQAIDAIGAAAAGLSARRGAAWGGIHDGPGISIKLSALHPRCARAQLERVLAELYPRLRGLAQRARAADIGLNIDAEESERLELSLELLERLCREPALAGWHGIGFVVQTYQKRCPAVVDWLIELGRRSGHRLMVRLVKGAYWDSEIKRAQADGQAGYPVYTRKAHTDLAYLACAKRLLAAPDAVFPQFATHNAHTLAAVHALAGPDAGPERYEFQCLHGMGEPLYEQVVVPVCEGGLGRACRIYAPVGTHETLLAYLVRRLLENGANTSFVHRIADAGLPLRELVEDPAHTVQQLAAREGAIGLPHPAIALPAALYGRSRLNSRGLDLADEAALAEVAAALQASHGQAFTAEPLLGVDAQPEPGQPVCNPAERGDVVGSVREASAADVQAALAVAAAAAASWAAVPAVERAALLERAAERLDAGRLTLIALLVREAGKTAANAIAEVREAIDFLRYDAMQLRQGWSDQTHLPLGPVVCISPWNFPLSIFSGQVAAALAAGNPVLAKPAEQTPLVAALAVRALHEAGVPRAALQLLPGRGETVGAALAGDARVQGVVFTGSTEVARLLQRTLAQRLGAGGRPVPLIAETGGQNAMLADSSALAEQVVADALASAFDSAGQRCSALRVLCVQADAAERVFGMLEGAAAELRVGDPRALDTDVGPVIDEQARAAIERHLQQMQSRGRRMLRPAAWHAPASGCFVAPAIVEIEAIAELQREVFGPVLHVLRWERDALDALVQQINATGYALTLGVHTRIDETVARIAGAARAGNVYVNRNIVGAVVGVQPFGGEGLSGTGPKAGGPLYLLRLLRRCPGDAARAAVEAIAPAAGAALPGLPGLHFGAAAAEDAVPALRQWAQSSGRDALAIACGSYARQSPLLGPRQLRGPTGESNLYLLQPRAAVLCLASSDDDRLLQLAAVLALGTRALWPAAAAALHAALPPAVRERIRLLPDDALGDAPLDAVLLHGDAARRAEVAQWLARRPGAIIGLQALEPGDAAIALERLVVERSLSINTAAAGGNASLMTMG
ncbi:MAG TPA: trifunctional transcriptional regulator/proline dehydrogenase/L-glutamate gamma-semialdehyde dehydrogenase [Rubrivivax sp.]|nr:trifunctional transcriptional regulator/proline dehydrogenase/L-glutamate gamma-semialdehyde dehydrogenase [Rubrivivax sp.]